MAKYRPETYARLRDSAEKEVPANLKQIVDTGRLARTEARNARARSLGYAAGVGCGEGGGLLRIYKCSRPLYLLRCADVRTAAPIMEKSLLLV